MPVPFLSISASPYAAPPVGSLGRQLGVARRLSASFLDKLGRCLFALWLPPAPRLAFTVATVGSYPYYGLTPRLCAARPQSRLVCMKQGGWQARGYSPLGWLARQPCWWKLQQSTLGSRGKCLSVLPAIGFRLSAGLLDRQLCQTSQHVRSVVAVGACPYCGI